MQFQRLQVQIFFKDCLELPQAQETPQAPSRYRLIMYIQFLAIITQYSEVMLLIQGTQKLEILIGQTAVLRMPKRSMFELLITQKQLFNMLGFLAKATVCKSIRRTCFFGQWKTTFYSYSYIRLNKNSKTFAQEVLISGKTLETFLMRFCQAKNFIISLPKSFIPTALDTTNSWKTERVYSMTSFYFLNCLIPNSKLYIDSPQIQINNQKMGFWVGGQLRGGVIWAQSRFLVVYNVFREKIMLLAWEAFCELLWLKPKLLVLTSKSPKNWFSCIVIFIDCTSTWKNQRKIIEITLFLLKQTTPSSLLLSIRWGGQIAKQKYIIIAEYVLLNSIYLNILIIELINEQDSQLFVYIRLYDHSLRDRLVCRSCCFWPRMRCNQYLEIYFQREVQLDLALAF